MFCKKVLLLVSSVVLLTACDENLIDKVRAYANRSKLEQCRNNDSRCAGGYVKFCDTLAINRISRHDGEGTLTVRANHLVTGMDTQGDVYLTQIQDIVLPDDSRWPEFATKYAKQFVMMQN